MSETKEQIKRAVGTVLLPLMPARAERVMQESFSMTTGRRDFIDSCIRAGLANKLLANNDEEKMAELHQQFWEHNNSVPYHRGLRDTVLKVFNEHYRFLLTEINELVANHPEIDTLVEIGAGGGSLLDLLSRETIGIKRFVGIDLSPDIIEENRNQYPDPRIEWVADDGKAWVDANGGANTIYITFRGVLEYFTQPMLAEMLQRICSEKSPNMFVSVEPMALSHDISTGLNSRPYGTENTFSHNYPHLFAEAGYTLLTSRVLEFDDHKLCCVIGTSGL